MRAHRFRQRERLRKRQQFLNVLKSGVRKESLNFTCALRANGLPWPRLGLTVGKRTGNAVVRNRIKRQLREYFRLNKERFPDSTDIVISAKTGAARLEFTAFNQEISCLLNSVTTQRGESH